MTLLDGARADDSEAWDRLVGLYAPTIYRWCRMDGVFREDAKDLTQEILFTVAKRLKDFRKRARQDSFRAWLRQTTRNRVTDFRRAAAHEPRRAFGGVPRGKLSYKNVVAPNSDLSHLSESVDGQLQLFEKISERVRQRCGEKSWAIFTYYVVDEFSAEETSRAFDVSPGYVHLVKVRMLRRLRAELAEEHGAQGLESPEET